MNETNITSYLFGLIIGGALTGGIVGGFFTQWHGDISSILSGVGGFLAFAGLMVHALYLLES